MSKISQPFPTSFAITPRGCATQMPRSLVLTTSSHSVQMNATFEASAKSRAARFLERNRPQLKKAELVHTFRQFPRQQITFALPPHCQSASERSSPIPLGFTFAFSRMRGENEEVSA